MKKRHYYIILFISLVIIPISFYGLLNNAVSKKYELNDPSDCISLETGQDLCLWENILLGSIGGAILLMLLCIYKLALQKR